MGSLFKKGLEFHKQLHQHVFARRTDNDASQPRVGQLDNQVHTGEVFCLPTIVTELNFSEGFRNPENGTHSKSWKADVPRCLSLDAQDHGPSRLADPYFIARYVSTSKEYPMHSNVSFSIDGKISYVYVCTQ